MSKNFEVLQKLTEARRGRPGPVHAADLGPFRPHDASEPIIIAQSSLAGLGEARRGEIAKLVNRVLIAIPDQQCAIVFAAAEPGESAVRIAAWTSELLAQHTQAEICVVDTAFLTPALHELFAVPNRGLAEALTERGAVRDLRNALPRIYG